MAELKVTPASVVDAHCEYNSVDSAHPLTTVIGHDETSEEYARVYMTKGGAASTQLLYSFDTSAIPENAEIGTVSLRAKGRMQNGSVLRGGTNTIALCENSTIIKRSDSTTVFGTSESIATLETTEFTRSMLENLCFRFFGNRGYLSTSTSYYMDFFGCSVTIEFTVPTQSDYFMLKTGGSWVAGSALYKKVDGAWVQQTDLSAAFDDETKYRSDALS